MSKYDKDKKFYWLQVKEDFFEEDALDWLEDQENGKEYSLFYLKLCLKSLKTNGVLIRSVGNMLIPYDNEKLAEMTKFPLDTVIVAMELLKRIGLVEILENGEIYLTQIQNMIGQQSVGAFKKQQQRRLKDTENTVEGELLPEGGQMSAECPKKVHQSLDLELEIDRYINNYNKKDLDLKNSKKIMELEKIYERAELVIDDNVKHLIDPYQIKRIYFFQDVVADIYGSTNRLLLQKLSYELIIKIENACRKVCEETEIEDYFKYFKSALINELIKLSPKKREECIRDG